MKESFSGVQAYGRCPRKYQYGYVDKIQRIRRSVELFWGSEAHAMFQVVYFRLLEGGTQQEAMNELEDHIAQRMIAVEKDPVLFTDEQAKAKDMIEEAAAMVRRYLDKYHDESWEILAVEEQFSVTLSSGDTFTYTPDLVIRDRHGHIWIVDWKTTAMSVPELPEVPFDNLQVLGYSIGAKAYYGPSFKGFIFIRLRKKTPTQPRLNKTKDKATGYQFVNGLKSIDTTFEILRDFLTEEAPHLLDHAAHKQRLAELRTTEKFHWRETIIITDAMIDNAEQDIIGAMDSMQHTADLGFYPRVYSPNPFDGCKRCEFHSLCRSTLLGWNTESILDEEFQDRDMSHKEYETEEEPF